MKDMTGREIRVGDYVMHFIGTRGGFWVRYVYVFGFSKLQVRLPQRCSYNLKLSTFTPSNIIVRNDIPLEFRDEEANETLIKYNELSSTNIEVNLDQLEIIYNKKEDTNESEDSGCGGDRILFSSSH